MSYRFIACLIAATFLIHIADSAPAHAVITLTESDLDLWMDEEGRLNLNMSSGAMVRVTTWNKTHLNMEYTGNSNNDVLLHNGNYLDCSLTNSAQSKIILCNRTSPDPTSGPTSLPPSQGTRGLVSKDIIGIIVAVVLTTVMVIVVAIMIIRGMSKKEKTREIEETGGTENSAFNSQQQNHPDQPTSIATHHPEPNDNRALSDSVEGLISAPETPTIDRKHGVNVIRNNTYL